MKTFTFDLETTGVDHTVHGIHQIAAIIECGGETTELNYKVRPRKGCFVSPQALEVGNVTLDQIREYPPMNEVFADLCKHLNERCDKFDKKDKFFMVGFNCAGFDIPFLRRFWDDCGDKYFGSMFWPNSLDVFVLATKELIDRRPEMPNFKLHTVARELGLEVDESRLHDALYDCQLTKQMFEKLMAGGVN